MIEALGGIFGGLGLFFVGTWLLSENLDDLTNRRFRMAAASLVSNRFAGYGWGVLAGSVTQGTMALTFIVAGMLQANFVSNARAFAILVGGNVGAVLIVPVISLDIRLAALYAVGLVGLLMASSWGARFQNVAMALFGIALMLIGLALIRESAEPIVGQQWVQDLLDVSRRSWWISFAVAAVLAALLPVAGVAILGITMLSAGLLTMDQVIMFVYGAHFGASCVLFLISWPLNVTSRRIAMFQVMFGFALCLIFVPLLYIENWSGLPLGKALVESIGLEPEKQLGIYVILLPVITGIPVFLCIGWIERLYSRLWPASEMENLSRTVFIKDRSYRDVGIALQLAVLEQQRVLNAFPSYMDAVRRGDNAEELDELSDSVKSVLDEISEFITELRRRHPGHSPQAINSVMAQQRLIIWLEEQFEELCAELMELPDDAESGQLRYVLLEGIDTVVITVNESLSSTDPEHWPMASQLTYDLSDALDKIRNDYLSGGVPLSDQTRDIALKTTNTTGVIFFLFSWLAQEKEEFLALSRHRVGQHRKMIGANLPRLSQVRRSFQSRRARLRGDS